MQEQIYIIDDVHGCYKTLLALIDKLPNKQKSKICFVGDLIDRGSNSKDVIEFVRSNNYDCVLGNHESLMIESIDETFKNSKMDNDTLFWINKCGGKETIDSYRTNKKLDDIALQEDNNWLKSLPLYIKYKDQKSKDGRYLVVSHSAVSKVWNLRNSKNQDNQRVFKEHLLWNRKRFCDNNDIFNVYGHTILEEVLLNEYSANIDLGCYSKNKLINPRLCALEFPSMRIIIQKNLEK